MLAWLQSIDTALFRLINQTLSCLTLDVLMPPLAGNPYFIPAAIVGAAVLCWKGGVRGRLFVLVLGLILSIGDTAVIASMKAAVGRLRPFYDLPDANVLVGRGDKGSMPSGHASLWSAAAMVAFVYYPRSRWVMVPFAALMCFSRVYLGVHYPSDTLAGAVLGTGYAAALLWTLNVVWQWAGRRWFPLWWRRLPTLVFRGPVELAGAQTPVTEEERALRETQLIRLGFVLIAALLVARLGYIASGVIELSQDEAYQWLWSKNLALSYWSKPPMIACAQWLGTHLWGDMAFGVRFLSPVIAAVLGVVMLRFMASVANAGLALLLLLAVTVTPMLAAGSVLMSVDALLVLFWTMAMVAGWRAAQPDGTARDWLRVGLWMGLGFLSKYTALLQLPCWAVFFILWRPARTHLRRPGPWLALAVFAICTLPVIIWNAQHGWITIEHVATNAKLEKTWEPTLKYFGDFAGTEAALLHPLFFLAALWAMAAFWKRHRDQPLFIYFFAMGTPVFLGYWLFTLHSRVQPNWIVCAVIPMFCLAGVYWEARWREGARAVNKWLTAALVIGFMALPFIHDTDLTWKVFRTRLPAAKDPLRRVREISAIANTVARARASLLKEGREVFVITPHYGPASQVTFYLPEARAGLPDAPLVFTPISKQTPKSQFFFWPHYRYAGQRRGQNAIFFVLDEDPRSPPEHLLRQFESVSALGMIQIKRHRRVFHHVQLFACRNLL